MAILVGVIDHQHPEVLNTAAKLAASLKWDLVSTFAVTELEAYEHRERGAINFETLKSDALEDLGVEPILRLRPSVDAAPRAIFWVLGIPRKRIFGFTAAMPHSSTVASLPVNRNVPYW